MPHDLLLSSGSRSAEFCTACACPPTHGHHLSYLRSPLVPVSLDTMYLRQVQGWRPGQQHKGTLPPLTRQSDMLYTLQLLAMGAGRGSPTAYASIPGVLLTTS